jgi:hypothetical protein
MPPHLPVLYVLPLTQRTPRVADKPTPPAMFLTNLTHHVSQIHPHLPVSVVVPLIHAYAAFGVLEPPGSLWCAFVGAYACLCVCVCVCVCARVFVPMPVLCVYVCVRVRAFVPMLVLCVPLIHGGVCLV